MIRLLIAREEPFLWVSDHRHEHRKNFIVLLKNRHSDISLEVTTLDGEF